MGVFLPEPNDDWKKTHVYVIRETVVRSFKKVRGSFMLSDGTVTKWTMKKGSYWYDHNDKCPENVSLTRTRIKQILEEAAIPNEFHSKPKEFLGGPPKDIKPGAIAEEQQEATDGRDSDVSDSREPSV